MKYNIEKRKVQYEKSKKRKLFSREETRGVSRRKKKIKDKWRKRNCFMNRRERKEYIMIHYVFLGVSKEESEMSTI